MAKRIAPETKWLAKMLYCGDRLSFAETAKQVKVSEAVVRKWADQYHWLEEREAIAATEWEIRGNTVKARAMALRKLLAWEDDKETALALSMVDKLERLALSAARAERSRLKNGGKSTAVPQSEPARAMAGKSLPAGLSDAERLLHLEEGVNRQIAHILNSPVENMSERMRGIKASLDVLASLRGKDARASIKVSFDE